MTMLQSAQSTTDVRTSTRYEDHTGMLHKLAKRGWGRLLENGLETPYEDVFQQMCESFVKCQATYKADTGFSFSAYYGRSIWNNFNKWAERLIEEKHTLGMVSVESLCGSDEEGERDVYEFIEQNEDDADDSPEERLAARQESHRLARMLSDDAKRIVALLVNPTADLQAWFDARNARMLKKFQHINIWMIGEYLELKRDKTARLRLELERVYGVIL
jgi:DNA-directed RNA polymerase specialized sigma24 family protein